MKVYIEDGCIGCGLCEGVCPEVFKMGDSGLAEVYADANSNPDGVQEAEDSCPVSVIKVEE